MARSALLNIMVQATQKAGRRLTRDFGEVENLQVSLKGPGDFVSSSDKEAEENIHYALNKGRPGYSFLMEERGAVGGNPDHRWIVDPLDGTTNFLHSLPIFAISIALESFGEIVAGVIYNPVMNEMFTAEKGQGAYLNDRRIRVSARRKMSDCVIGTGVPAISKKGHVEAARQQAVLSDQVAGIRATGSAALNLAWTAAGRMDAYLEAGLKPWDLAAGIVIMREAGGFITDYDGRQKMFETENVVAGTEAIHAKVLKVIAGE